MRVLVCGSRDCKDRDFVIRTLEQRFCPDPKPDDMSTWMPPGDLVLIHGGAKGVDHHADEWAVVNWVPVECFEADWKRYGNSAGPIRNQQMIDEGKPDLVIAFPGGRGTADMVRRAKAAGIKVEEIKK